MNDYIKLTVSELNECIKTVFDAAMPPKICVVGEISNFTNHYKTGHFYFTLKDENALIKAVMFRTYSSSVTFKPESSMKVLAYGRVSVFPRDGVYQLYVEKLEPFGIGDLYAAFEQTKKKLSQMGLFDESAKKPIPRFPSRIGIITSPEAAAVADMKNIISRRYPLCEIHIYPSLVQGKEAPKELCDGIVYFDNDKKCDVIIIGRGGGSIEDLWAFNDETLAKTIFACNTPVISAVGHETDFTICDFVADLRAPTPSAAAELAVPDIADLKNTLHLIKSSLFNSINLVFSAKKHTLEILSEKNCLKSPMFYIESKLEELSRLDRKISDAANSIYDKKKQSLGLVATKLTALNPMKVLSRGYGAVFDEKSTVVTKAQSVHEGDKISITLSDGQIDSKIIKITLKEENK